MIKRYPLSKLTREMELVPQAILGTAVAQLAERYGWQLEEGHDDLDDFVGAAFVMPPSRPGAKGTPFAIMHYRGHPENTATIYLPFEIQDVSEISNTISRIARSLEISEKIIWERKYEQRTLPA